MSKNKKWTLATVLVLMVALLLTGCGGGKENNQDAQGNSTAANQESIIRSTASDVPNIDPGVGSDYASSIAFANVYDTLVFPAHDGSLKPWLATDWQTSEDGLTWVFNLRPGVKFHNGDELTADDVVFSMQRMITIGEGYGYLFSGVVKEAKALDKNKVQFTLNKKFGPFLSTLVRLYVLDKNQVMANKKPGPYGDMGDYGKDWLVTHDAGSGPYMVKELKKEEYMYAVKFNDFWGGWEKDAPEAIKIIGTTAGPTVRTLMTQKQLEQSDQWQTEEALKALDNIPGVSIDAGFTGSMLNIMLNNKKAPTDDVHFRKALAYAFDYQTVVDKLFPGCKKAQGPVQFNLPGFNPNLPQYERNLDKAKAELAQSKYAGKLDQYPVDIVWIANVPDEEKIALLFQANAAEIGIKVNIVKTPWLSFVDQVATPDNTPNASVVFVSPHYNEAGSMLESRYHSKSTGTWEQGEWLKNPEIDADIEDALGTLDQNERYAKYQKIQEKLVDLCPSIWVFDQAEKRAYQDYIQWPGAELNKQGKPVSSVMGYNFYYHDYKVTSQK